MPKHYCDYCDVFLTHDSASVRKAHNNGRNHLANVRDYYASLGHDKAQNIIDQITSAYESSGGPPPGGFGFGPQHLAPPVASFGPPGGGFGGPGGPPMFGRPPFPPPPAMGPPGMGPPPPGMMPPGGFPPGMPPFPPANGGPNAPLGGQAGNRPPMPPNPNFPPSQGPPQHTDFNGPPGNYPPQNGPPGQPPSGDGPGGIHPDRLRMMGGR
ncbi:U1 small nuclear ribonucleoprotein C [Abortiporus biennis]